MELLTNFDTVFDDSLNKLKILEIINILKNFKYHHIEKEKMEARYRAIVGTFLCDSTIDDTISHYEGILGIVK